MSKSYKSVQNYCNLKTDSRNTLFWLKKMAKKATARKRVWT